MTEGRVRIGELSRRVGVSPELLRAWETRYDLLRPERTAGGFRLYTAHDERRVRTMQAHLERGLSASEAARLTLTAAEPVEELEDGALETAREALGEALARYDDQAANGVIDDLIARFTIETVLRDAIVPFLHELGESWKRGDTSVSQEHYASNLIQARLLALARNWGEGSGPLALLACVPAELHTLGLIAFGLALHRRGWRLSFLGADTPVAEVAAAAERLVPQLVMLSSVTTATLRPVAGELAALAGSHRVAVGGEAARSPLVTEIGAAPVTADPVTAAAQLAGGAAARAA